MSMPERKNKGFTLVEVLVTIAVIGIISSLTIPGLIHNIQQAQNKAAWKKVYSVLSQATDQIREDNGGTVKGVWYNGGAIIPVYQKYLNIVKRCNWPQAANPGCWASTTESGSVAGAVLSDGTFIQVDGDENCFGGCAKIIVDVNGAKGPNECGVDLFKFDVLENRQLPSGADGAYWVAKACWHNSSLFLTQ